MGFLNSLFISRLKHQDGELPLELSLLREKKDRKSDLFHTALQNMNRAIAKFMIITLTSNKQAPEEAWPQSDLMDAVSCQPLNTSYCISS